MLRGRRLCEGGEFLWPAFRARDGVAQRLPAVSVAINVPMFDVNARAVRTFRDERDLDLTRPARVGLDLPLGADIPAEPQSIRRIDGEHPRPA